MGKLGVIMKYLLIFLISFNVFSMSLEDIENMSVNNNLQELVQRVDSDCILEILPKSDIDDVRSNYERMVATNCEKPSFDSLVAELVVLKSELAVEENARLAEVARLVDMKNRIKAMKDLVDFRFLPPSTKEIYNTKMYMSKKLLNNPDKADAENELVECEERAQIVHAQMQIRESKKAEEQSIKNFIKNFDCGSLNGVFIKKLCQERQL